MLPSASMGPSSYHPSSGQARLPYKLYRLLCGSFRRIPIGIVGHDLIRRSGIKSCVAVDGAVLYRTTIAAVNAAGSVSVTGFIPQISDIIRIRVVSKGMNLRI